MWKDQRINLVSTIHQTTLTKCGLKTLLFGFTFNYLFILMPDFRQISYFLHGKNKH